jgi:hypothetical protein
LIGRRTFSPVSALFHSTAWFAAVALLYLMHRAIGRASRAAGLIALAGTLLRAAAGAALFFISLYHLPILRSLQLERGFWALAPDGPIYFDAARVAAIRGISTIPAASASPDYVRPLALALWIFGASPLSAILLNLIAYAAASWLVVAMWPRAGAAGSRRSLVFAQLALAFTPSLLLSATQPLKDQLFVMLVAAALLGLQRVLPAAGPRPWKPALVAGSLALSTIAIDGIGGIRAYYAVLVVMAAVLVMGVRTFTPPPRRWLTRAGATALTAAALWVGFVHGAGPYAATYNRGLRTVLRLPLTSNADADIAAAAAPLAEAREGFVSTGGATALVRRRRAARPTLGDVVEDEAFGLLACVTPVAVLRFAVPAVAAGGHGLLAITDLDTVFLDLTIGLQFFLVVRYWRAEGRDPGWLAFTVALGLLVLLPMAYVVTNYGTLFRLRVIYAVPLWMSGAALGRTGSRSADSASSG